MTRLPVSVEPVKPILPTLLRQSAAPVSPSPVTTCSTRCWGTTLANAAASHNPTPGEYSLGLNTTVLPAASANATELSGVNTG